MFSKPDPRPDLPKLEREVLAYWKDKDVFRRSIRGDKEFVFYDGPPFATGTPHYGHLLAGTLKDVVPRYWTMRGYRVERRFGWDTHGLPVEMEMEKTLGLSGPSSVEEYGVPEFNEACRSIVFRYVDQWREVVTRLGRWVDFDNDYKTLDPSFMESVWWVFNELWDKDLIYQGYKVMPYSYRLGTPLSNFEANMDYRKVQDPAVTVAFPLRCREGVSLLAWTTTPWTLPSNMALCVGPEVRYVEARKAGEEATYIVAEARCEAILGEGAEILRAFDGAELVGETYEPLFDFFADKREEGAFRIVSDPYVTDTDGTGVVHMAPAFGEDDGRVCQREGVPMVDPVDEEGRFTEDVPVVTGLLIKEADAVLIREIKESGKLFHRATIDHEYPFCWRSGTPLMYKAIKTWFVRVTDLRERMAKNNEQTRWVPDYVGSRRFGNWILDARDWSISRNRYWGTPLPVWSCDSCDEIECLGSREALEARAGVEVPDLHKHFIDELTWECANCGGSMRRVPEVLDCWFESGSMPYAQNHYPFENKEMVEQNLPAHFIAEGLDQTRGWFYTLLVLSTALFDRPAFQNVIVNGLILAEDGRKMSKSLKNYPDPTEVIEAHGADALRAYLINSPVVRAEPMRFAEQGVRDVVRSVILPLWNAYSFFATYASVDGWTPPAKGEASPISERALLDRWVISVQQSLIAEVNEEMEAYRLYNVIPAVLGFVDDLTNWYIRRSRRRFWRTENDNDKQHAFETLYEVLTTFSRLLAPILPFIAEVLYQRLEVGIRDGALDSVHLEYFPEADASLVDTDLERQMAVVREAVGLGRNVREQQKIRTRQPLSCLTVASDSPLAAPLRDIVSEELNVKAVEQVDDVSELVTLKTKANFKVLGRRLGKRMKPIAAVIATFTPEQIGALRAGESIEVDGESIGIEDVQVIQEAVADGGAVASSGTVTVRLDTTLTPELEREGLARELISKVQGLRKDAELQVDDRIVLSVQTESEDMRAALEEYSALLCSETLTSERADLQMDHASISCVGHEVQVALRKA
jgi:isoleucyl-tRNA synthetase